MLILGNVCTATTAFKPVGSQRWEKYELGKKGKVVVIGGGHRLSGIRTGQNTYALDFAGLCGEKAPVIFVEIYLFFEPAILLGLAIAKNDDLASAVKRIGKMSSRWQLRTPYILEDSWPVLIIEDDIHLGGGVVLVGIAFVGALRQLAHPPTPGKPPLLPGVEDMLQTDLKGLLVRVSAQEAV